MKTLFKRSILLSLLVFLSGHLVLGAENTSAREYIKKGSQELKQGQAALKNNRLDEALACFNRALTNASDALKCTDIDNGGNRKLANDLKKQAQEGLEEAKRKKEAAQSQTSARQTNTPPRRESPPARRQEDPYKIVSIDFAAITKSGVIVTEYGRKLTTDMQYLSPRVTYDNPGSQSVNVELNIKIFSPNGTMIKQSGTPGDYTYTSVLTMMPGTTGGIATLSSFGSETSSLFTLDDNYRFEVYIKDKMEFTTRFAVNKPEVPVTVVPTVERTNEPRRTTTLSADAMTVRFDPSGGKRTVTITTNETDWRLWGERISWGRVDVASKNSVTVTCNPNATTQPRTDYFKVYAGDKSIEITIVQEGKKARKKSNVWALKSDEIYKWGITAGYVQKQFKYKDNDGGTNSYGYLKDSQIPGLQVGIKYEGYFNPDLFGLGITTGLYYEFYRQKGDVQEDTDIDYYYSIKEHSLYLPVGLIYRVDFTEQLNMVLHGGVGFNYGLAAKFEGKDIGEKEAWYTETDLYDYEEWGLRRLHINAEFGVGLRYNRIGLDAKFGVPLTDWSNDVYYTEKMNKGLTIGLSFMF